MESIFFRRLEPRRSTQTIVPNITGAAGLMPPGMMNPQYTTQVSIGPSYCGIVGGCQIMDPPDLQSVFGTLGNIPRGGISSQYLNVGQYNVGTYNWGGYNLGVGNIMGSCPEIDSPGLQSVVGTLGKFFGGGSSIGRPSTYSPSSALLGRATCYDYGYTPTCFDFGYSPPGCLFIGGGGCDIAIGCAYIGGSCKNIGGPCLYIGGGCLDFGYCPYIGGGCYDFGGCMVMDPAPFSSIIGTFNSYQQY